MVGGGGKLLKISLLAGISLLKDRNSAFIVCTVFRMLLCKILLIITLYVLNFSTAKVWQKKNTVIPAYAGIFISDSKIPAYAGLGMNFIQTQK